MKKIKQYVLENKWALIAISTFLLVAFVFADTWSKAPITMQIAMWVLEVIYIYIAGRLDQSVLREKRLKKDLITQAKFFEKRERRY